MVVNAYYILKKWRVPILIFSFILIVISSVNLIVSPAQGKRPLPEFKNLQENTSKFIRYYYNIQLTASEQRILEKALSEIPAPCCSDYTALTC